METRLFANEQKEWNSLKKKSANWGIPITLIKGTANVVFRDGVYAQLGTGRATMIMDARITIQKRNKRERR
jgi:hypothetical protein